MAGTIISTPSLGSSDWSDWITQQERTDRGYMRVSLTNFSGTAASSIATGSVMECAGSIYQFTETSMSLATGTASASVSVYFHVIPSAGGTSCTIEMDSTAPTWVDAKQGFYASAASTTRVVGGCYIGTAATYYSKYLYTGENLVYCLQTGETRPLLKKILEIGEWDMDLSGTKTIAHELEYTKIRSIHVIVRNDANTNYYPLDIGITDNDVSDGRWSHDETNVTTIRVLNGFFDSVSFDGTASTVANRGWVTIVYEA